MLAEDFGYQLSPRPAEAMTPKVKEAVDASLEAAAKATEKDGAAASNFGYVLTFIIAVVAGVSSANGWVFFGVFVFGYLMSASAGASTKARAKAKENSLREMTHPVRAGRWQTWPCRM